MKINLDFSLLNEVGNEVGNAALSVTGSLMRLQATDEHSILKVGVFIDQLKKNKSLELDEADARLFKSVLLSSDAIVLVKRAILQILNDAMLPKP